MNAIPLAGVIAMSLVVAACGEAQNAGPENRQISEVGQTASLSSQVHSATGTVRSIAGDKVTIAHGPIESAGWPAMTMAFTAPSGVAEGVEAGSQVDFSFHQDDGTYVLSSLRKR